MATQSRVGWRPYVNLQVVQRSLVSTNLLLNLDSSISTSYSGTGNTWNNISSNTQYVTSGSLQSGVSYSSQSNGTLVFNGTSGYVTLGDDKLRLQDNFSLEAWFKFSELPTNTGNSCGARHPIVYNNDWGYNLLIGSDGKLMFQVYNSFSTNVVITTSGSVISTDFIHVVGIKQGTTVKMYLNSVLVGTATLTSNQVYYHQGGSPSVSPFLIGVGICGGQYFYAKGSISVIRFYNKVLTETEITQNFDYGKDRFGYLTVSDADVQSFINISKNKNSVQASAINTLVTDLKAANIWTKMKAIYPFVGGTAESHKWNLKDPRDMNNAFRIQFYGGWTHSSTGALPNGTTAYADTKLIPSQQYSINSSVSFGVYSRNDKLENSTELSAYSGPTQNMGMEPRWSDGKFYGYAWQDGVGITSVTPNSGTLGLLSVTRQSYNILKTFRNNILIGNQAANVAGSFPTNSVRLSMGGVAGYSSREKAFAYIGDGISDNEISLLSTAVQRFQTSLARHVGVPVGTTLTKPVESPNIVSTGLVFNIDPSNTSSYPGTGTTVYDLSGNNYTGTLQSGCYYDSESLGNFVFDGINDYINLPHSILSGTGDFTVNVWVKNINSQYGTIFANYPAGNLQIFYGSNSIGFWLNNSTAYMTSTNSIKETTTIPRMLTAIRRNGSILEVYLDGVLKKTGSSTATIGNVSNFRMGSNTVGTETMNTSIYTIQAYSRALSTIEITQNYNATKWRFGL